MKNSNYNGVAVYYTTDLQGGGQGYGHEEYMKRLKGGPAIGRLFEWCSGPAFIGFSLLAHNVCESLCLADINPEAVRACQKTVSDNNLEDRVSVYLSNNLENIPETEQWGFVIGNPPHFDDDKSGMTALRSFDPGWKVHETFYSQLGRHLKDDGLSLIIENNGSESVYEGSVIGTFVSQIEKGGLKMVYTSVLETRPRMYWVGSMHSQEAWENSPWKLFLT